jgi:uncharacterized protein YjbI with pentapeptide repeats
MASEPPPSVADEPQLKQPPPLAAKSNDLEALRTAVVDAANVGAGLWVSYLFVLFYMLVAAGGVTHKDMFFESPVRLPFLNVDLPLTGFFWLGPTLFVIVHAYVLLHFVMLAGKVSAFDSELRDQIDNVEVRRRLRRQLPSNIFVQFLAGPPEVRDGVMGVLLWLIALISLVLAPVALLVFFELQFLPYHHDWITWWQRLAVGIDLLLIWLFWPTIALRQEAEQETTPRRPVPVIQRVGTIGSMYAISVASVLLVGVVATFPGERLEAVQHQVNPTFVQEALVAVREALVAGKVDTARRKPESLWSNRLVLPGLDVIERTKLDSEAKIAAASDTASLRARNLEGAVLIGAGLRKVDFTGANLRGAFLDKADLRDAKLDCALPFREGSQDTREPVLCVQLEGASLIETQLQGASLNGAQLQGASLYGAQLQGASLNGAQLQGALLNHVDRVQTGERRTLDSTEEKNNPAQLQGASLDGAQFQGASLDGVQLQATSLDRAQLQGASLNGAQLQGASLIETQLQGASLAGAELQGATLKGTFMWRVDWKNSNPTSALISWSRCKPEVACDDLMANGGCPWTRQRFRELRDKMNHEIPEGPGWKLALDRIDQRLDPDMPFPDVEGTPTCYASTNAGDATGAYEAEVAEQWQRAGCAVEGLPHVVSRLITRMTNSYISPFAANSLHSAQLAGAFLAETCKGARGLSEREIATLRNLSVLPPPKSP